MTPEQRAIFIDSVYRMLMDNAGNRITGVVVNGMMLSIEQMLPKTEEPAAPSAADTPSEPADKSEGA